MDSWVLWRESLKSPRYILAPMVDHSELPWRMLSQEYGCQAAYTPMIHAANFVQSKKYRDKNFSTCPEDRPLIVQFCANNASILLEAAKYVEEHCDAIDINLGCPQEIAKRGHYGAFLQDEWNIIEEMVAKLRSNISDRVAVSCKIRRFDDIKKTVEYGKMLEKAGCNFIGVHGRTREQRGCNSGLADWSYIKAVKESLKIPVVANGNIQSLYDADNCLDYTGADAIMTAEGNLYNPGILLNQHPPSWTIARKYLNYVEKYPIVPGMAKSHLFKLFHKCISAEENMEICTKLGKANTLMKLHEVVDYFQQKYEQIGQDQTLPICTLPVPPYLCQPRYRGSVGTEVKKVDHKPAICEDDTRIAETNGQHEQEASQKRIRVN